mgnify:CR=1 FL=1
MSRNEAPLRFTDTERKILQYHIMGLSPKEIAKKVNCSVKTVYKAVSKYRRALREGYPVEKLHSLIMSNNIDRIMPLLQNGIPFIQIHDQGSSARVFMTPLITLPLNDILEINSFLKELINCIRILTENIREVKEELSALRYTMIDIERRLITTSKPSYTTLSKVSNVQNRAPLYGKLPSYLVDNPWLKILASYGSQQDEVPS